MEYGILGPVQVVDEGQPVALGGSKRRAVLALLLLHANEVVSVDRLADDLWGDKPPRNAVAALHNHVSRLRKLLGPETLVTRSGGYCLQIDPQSFDLHEFERLTAEADAADPVARAALLHEALDLWRGPALADIIFEPFAAAESLRLEEARLAALENRIDADLELGRHGEVVGELEALVRSHPLRERLRAQLIVALYRGGRQAEALDAYRDTRRVLADELGLEPGPALKELERSILRHDPDLAPPPRARTETLIRRRRWRRSLGYVAAAAGAAAGVSIAIFVATSNADEPTRAAAPAGDAAIASKKTSAAPVTKPHVRTTRRHAQATTTTRRHKAPATATRTTRRTTTPASPRTPRRSSVRQKRGQTPVVPPPKRTVTAPVTKTPPAKRETVRFTDDFELAVPNRVVWWWNTFGTGVEMTQRRGRLEMRIAADAQPDSQFNSIMGSWQTKCRFWGDFDARVEYSTLEWPPANGARVGLGVYFGDNGAAVERTSHEWGEQYSFWMTTASHTLSTNDTRGALRLTRVKNTVTAYYRDGTHWEKLASGQHAGPADVGPQLSAAGSDFAHKDVTVYFDDFVVEGTQATC